MFNGYLEKLIGKVPEDNTLLDIVKPLAKFIALLPQYTRSTKTLDPRTIAVRDAFQQTQSPMKLLFEILPAACGYSSYIGTDFNNSNPSEFLNELARHLNSLNKAYENLLKSFQHQLANALKESPDLNLAALRAVLNKKYAGLEKYTVDTQELKAFISRLQDNKATDKAWLESVAAFLGKAPPDKWRQINRTDAEYRLIDLSDRLLQLALVHSHQLKADADTQVTVFRVVNEQGAKDKIAYLNTQLREQARAVVDGLEGFYCADKQLQPAIIAELINGVS
jgi:hypothetical protein